MLTSLMIFFVLLLAVAGVITWVLRRRRQFAHFSREEEETAQQLNRAFGRNLKWGRPGETEKEMHDRDSSHQAEAADDADAD